MLGAVYSLLRNSVIHSELGITIADYPVHLIFLYTYSLDINFENIP